MLGMGQTRTKSLKYSLSSPSWGENGSQNTRNQNAQMNVRNRLIFLFCERNALGIAYHANRKHFSHSERKYAKTTVTPTGRSFSNLSV